MNEPKQRALTQLHVGDIIEWRDQGGCYHRRWWVHGIHLGAMGQESVIALEAIDCSAAWDEIALPILHVPEVLTRTCRIAGRAESRDAAALAFKNADGKHS